MIKAIFNGLFKIINSLLGIILSPLNSLLTSLFPDLGTYINNFMSLLDNYLIGIGSFIFNFIPPMTKGLLIVIATFWITYKSAVWTYHNLSKIFVLIKKIKFW